MTYIVSCGALNFTHSLAKAGDGGTASPSFHPGPHFRGDI